KLALSIAIFRFAFSIIFIAASISRSQFWNILQLHNENQEIHPLVIRIIDLVPYWLLIEAFIYFWVHAAVIYASVKNKPWGYWPQLVLDALVLVQHFILTKFLVVTLIWLHFLHKAALELVEKRMQERSKGSDKLIKFILKQDPNDWFAEILAINSSLPNIWLIVGSLIVIWAVLTAALSFCLVVTWRAYRYMKELQLNESKMVSTEESQDLIKDKYFI
uniref:Uncharacterized protein n=1 Tax=Acrobeloides nanus TaxID=290746 RepID=A0A914CWF7_9BILA